MRNALMRFIDRLLLPAETRELADLNALWDRFNAGEDVEFEIISREWKYHERKARLLLQFHDLKRETPTKK